MTDRMDIDALLIGALYGELTPADEARLTAHLESHPADRSALADLTRTRARVRESRVLAVQLEPPQSVSALLLQEAARRAPRAQRDTESWFYRLARSFMAHPALATAAMVVVVVGVAGTLYMRHGDKLTESSATSAPPSLASESAVASAPAAPAPAAAPSPEAAPAAAAKESTVTTGKADDGRAAGAGAGSGAYGVGLAEGSLRQRTVDRSAEKARPSDGADGVLARDEVNEAPSADTIDRFSSPPPTALAKAEQKVQKKAAGIEIRSPEPSPKDFEKNKLAGAKRGVAGSRDADALFDSASDDLAQAPSKPSVATAQAPSRPPAATAPAAPPPPPPPPRAQPAPPAADPGTQQRTGPPKPIVSGNVGNAGNAAQRADTRPDAKDARLDSNAPARKTAPGAGQASQAPAGGSAPRNERQQGDRSGAQDLKLAEERDKSDSALIGWARNKHDQVIALVKSSNCSAAATAAMEIYSRAPAFYASNVATDRSVKPCLAYINNERQREDRLRAAKRANASDGVQSAPAQAAQPPPAQATPPVKK